MSNFTSPSSLQLCVLFPIHAVFAILGCFVIIISGRCPPTLFSNWWLRVHQLVLDVSYIAGGESFLSNVGLLGRRIFSSGADDLRKGRLNVSIFCNLSRSSKTLDCRKSLDGQRNFFPWVSYLSLAKSSCQCRRHYDSALFLCYQIICISCFQLLML